MYKRVGRLAGRVHHAGSYERGKKGEKVQTTRDERRRVRWNDR
jgi:hypothetical protein